MFLCENPDRVPVTAALPGTDWTVIRSSLGCGQSHTRRDALLRLPPVTWVLGVQDPSQWDLGPWAKWSIGLTGPLVGVGGQAVACTLSQCPLL